MYKKDLTTWVWVEYNGVSQGDTPTPPPPPPRGGGGGGSKNRARCAIVQQRKTPL